LKEGRYCVPEFRGYRDKLKISRCLSKADAGGDLSEDKGAGG
jgi:hypothetical protein